MIDSSKSSPASPPICPPELLRRGLQLSLCVALLLCLTQCSSKKGYQAANYSPEKLATPPHNLSQRDYPFDGSGKYRKDWVKSGSRSVSGNNINRPKTPTASSSSARTASTTPRPATATTRSSAPTQVAARSTSSAPRPQTQSSPAPAPKPAYKPAPKPKPKPKPAARYHTVQPKQTLWAISQKYGISVAALQKANGLTGTLIRPGQSLRIP